MKSWLVGGLCVVCGAAIVLAQAAPPRSQAPAAPAAATGLILGQVVDGSTGRPVPTAVVSLTPSGGGRGQSAAPSPLGSGPAVEREIVDDTGRFVFHDLPKGTMLIAATAPGYLSGAAGQALPSGPSRAIDLADGERIGDLRIRLWKYGVLSGTVLDEAGDAAVGVSVRALRRTMNGASLRLRTAGQATTDDRGQFRIASLTPGDYLVAVPQTQITVPVTFVTQFMQSLTSGGNSALMDVMASGGPAPNPLGVQVGDYLLQSGGRGVPLPPAADGRLLEYQTLFFPAAIAPGQATVIALRSGEEHAGVNVQLRLTGTVRVSGLASGPEGPMPNVGVRLLATSWEASIDDGLEVATTATGADGRFAFLGVPPGQYVAKILKPPRPQVPAELASNPLMQMMGSAMSAPPTGMAAMALYAQSPVSVGTTDVNGVMLTLTEGATLSGRVEFIGTSAPPTPRRLQTATITVLGLDGQPVNFGGAFGPLPAASPGARGNIGSDGQFKTVGLPPGRYFVTSSAIPLWTIASAVVNGHDALTEPIDVSTGDVDGLVVTFTDKVTSLTGTVRGAGSGSSIEATVIAFPADYQTWLSSGMSPRRTRQATASRTGTYTLNNLLPGDYVVAAVDEADLDGSRDAAFFAALTPLGTRVSIGAGDTRTVDLPIVRIK